MKEILNIAIYGMPIILAAISVTNRFTNANTWAKVITIFLLSSVAAFAASWKEEITDSETKRQTKIAERAAEKRDSLNRIINERDKLNIVQAFTEGFARYDLNIDKLLPPLNDIKIKSVSEGLIISYQVNKQLESLQLLLGPSPFDETFDATFGAGKVLLPKRIGRNEYKIEFKNIKFGEKITLEFKSENPYYSLPIINHYHTANNTTDVIVTADNTEIKADSDTKIK